MHFKVFPEVGDFLLFAAAPYPEKYLNSHELEFIRGHTDKTLYVLYRRSPFNVLRSGLIINVVDTNLKNDEYRIGTIRKLVITTNIAILWFENDCRVIEGCIDGM